MVKPHELNKHLNLMFSAIVKILEITDRGYEQFIATDDLVIEAEAMLGRVCDACNKIRENLEPQLPDIQWDSINRLRVMLDHVYHHLQVDAIWDTLVNSIPEVGKVIASKTNYPWPPQVSKPYDMQLDMLRATLNSGDKRLCGALRTNGESCRNPLGACPWH
jgi:uncharacterized protein with HEPN domain